jgi:geranylgeranyl diphosphate synthase, type II
MNAVEALRIKKAAVDGELVRLLAGDSRLFEAMRYAVLSGGKRFRPLILLASGEAFGGDASSLLPFACAIELIHAYSLVHDDLPCMDNDDIRRGKPSCHKAFGVDLALLAGDGLLTMAFEVMAGAPAGPGGAVRKERALAEIGRAAGVHGMIGGQWLDVTWPGSIGSNGAEASLEELILLKTGALISAASKAGALLGGADAAGLLAIEAYGKNIGLAFQLRDDILDSDRKAEGPSGTRPNSVAVFGLEGTKTRLSLAAERAMAALDTMGGGSDELRELAGNLLRLG